MSPGVAECNVLGVGKEAKTDKYFAMKGRLLFFVGLTKFVLC